MSKSIFRRSSMASRSSWANGSRVRSGSSQGRRSKCAEGSPLAGGPAPSRGVDGRIEATRRVQLLSRVTGFCYPLIRILPRTKLV